MEILLNKKGHLNAPFYEKQEKYKVINSA